MGAQLRQIVAVVEQPACAGKGQVRVIPSASKPPILLTTAARSMFHVIGAMAEFERALIQERVRAGLAVARSKDKTLGRPKVRRDRDRDAKRIRELRDEGQSYREIAEELGRSTMDVHRVAMTLGCVGAEQ